MMPSFWASNCSSAMQSSKNSSRGREYRHYGHDYRGMQMDKTSRVWNSWLRQNIWHQPNLCQGIALETIISFLISLQKNKTLAKYQLYTHACISRQGKGPSHSTKKRLTTYSPTPCSLSVYIYIQWNLRTRDTMGPTTLSLVERSFLSRRSNNTLKY